VHPLKINAAAAKTTDIILLIRITPFISTAFKLSLR